MHIKGEKKGAETCRRGGNQELRVKSVMSDAAPDSVA